MGNSPSRRFARRRSAGASKPMTFDEQVERAFGALADRLSEHITGELRSAAADLAAAAQAEREAAAARTSAEAREAAQADREAAVARASAEAREAAQADREAAVARASAEAREAAQADREAAVARASAEAREAAQADREAAIAAATAEARQAAQENVRQSLDAAVASERAGLKTADLATSERLLEAIRAIDRARSLSEILDILVSCAGREA